MRSSKVFASGASLRTLDDDSVLAFGNNLANDTYTFRTNTDLGSVTALRVEALQHPSMTKNGLSRSDSGNFVLTDIEITTTAQGVSSPEKIQIVSAEATFEQGSHKVTNAFDDDPKSGWAVWDGVHSIVRTPRCFDLIRLLS